MTNFYIAEILLLPRDLEEERTQENFLASLQTKIFSQLKDKELGLKNQKQPNILWFNQAMESFKIDLAREIIRESQFANFSASESNRVLVLLNFESATNAAQNALLKLIEEPPTNTLIVLPVFNENLILETIRSRALINRHLLEAASQEKAAAETGAGTGEETDIAAKKTSEAWPKSYQAAINLAEQYKERSAAQILVSQMLDSPQLNIKQRQALANCFSELKQNANVKLCLENCFFAELKK